MATHKIVQMKNQGAVSHTKNLLVFRYGTLTIHSGATYDTTGSRQWNEDFRMTE
jgi:hypothetical protein